MLDDASRRAKARKMAAVVGHFLGRETLDGLTVFDIGCSGGIVADELRGAGATVVGFDIDRPGLAKAQANFGGSSSFVCGDSASLPIQSAAADVVICNHVYEHVTDPVALVAELRRIVRPDGVLYLGLGNRWGIVEPHYRLPFLSWLPRAFAHRYVRAAGKADHYHEEFRTRRGLLQLFGGLHVWDYTYSVLLDPGRFGARDVVPSWFRHVPNSALRAVRILVPTYIWVATVSDLAPAGPPLQAPPAPIIVPR